ncbi:MAG: FliG C-terminal domain-containing protein [Pseudomonadota bacterium]
MTPHPSSTDQSGLDRSVALMTALGDQADAIWPLLSSEEAKQLRTALKTDSVSSTPKHIEDQATAQSFWDTFTAPKIRTLASLLERESPQISAIVLSKLPADRAALLVQSLPERRAAAALYRLAHLGAVLETALSAIERTLKTRLEESDRRSPNAPEEHIAEILDGVGGDRERRLLAALDHKESGLRDRISHHMFRFEDLSELDAAGTQTLISQIDRNVLIVALKHAPMDVEKAILKNMTRRAAELLKSEIEGTSPTPKDVETARRSIISLVRALTKRGEILIDRSAQRALVA